jgi:hypothetical protein
MKKKKELKQEIFHETMQPQILKKTQNDEVKQMHTHTCTHTLGRQKHLEVLSM